MSNEMTKRPRIAIVGGGPGGLTLARLLAMHGMAATVFELDASATARPQGGSLDLHTESGLRALALAGLMDGFRAVARYEDQAARIYDRAGQLLYAEAETEAGEGDRPEIDRDELKQLLLGALPAGAVEWGRKVVRIEPTDGAFAIHCDGHAPEVFDLVVGADGTWSRVRPLVSDERPSYTGCSFVELELDELDAKHPELAALVGRGKIFALADGKALIAQRNARSNLRVYVAHQVPEGWARAQAGVAPSQIKAALLADLAGWAPALRDFIVHSQDKALVLPLYALPVGARWAHRRGVTLLGDAAHVMSPFAGEGVNNAMHDAAELALALVAARDGDGDWDAAVARYEAAMFERTQPSAIASAEGLAAAMADDAAAQMVALMSSHGPPA